MANSAEPDQLASEEANRSGATLFAKTGLGLKVMDTLTGVRVGGNSFKMFSSLLLKGIYSKSNNSLSFEGNSFLLV